MAQKIIDMNISWTLSQNVQNVKEEKEASKVAKKLSEEGLDTHFHVWTSETFIDHIKKSY